MSIQRGSKEYIYNETISGFADIDSNSAASLRIAVVCSDDRPCAESLFNQLRQAADKDFSLEEKFYVPAKVIANSTDNTLAKNERDRFHARVDENSPANSEQHIYYSQSAPFCMGYFHPECTDLGQLNDILGLEVLLPLLCHSVNNLVRSKRRLANILDRIQHNTIDGELAELGEMAQASSDALVERKRTLALKGLENSQESKSEDMQALKHAISKLHLLPVHFRIILNLPPELFGDICSTIDNGNYPSIDRVVWIRPDAAFNQQLAQQAVAVKNSEIAKGTEANEALVQKMRGLHDDLTNINKDVYLDDIVISWVKELPDFIKLNLEHLDIHIDKDITSTRTNTNENRTNIK